MDNEPPIPIWFFIGGTLLLYGLIILGTGLYALVDPAVNAGIAMSNFHPGIWWGALMIAVGGFYVYWFHPWHKLK